MAVGGHIILEIYGKTNLTPKDLVNGAVVYANLNKKDEYKGDSFFSAIIEESHLIARDFGDHWVLEVYTCGNKEQLEKAVNYLISKFENKKILGFYTKRGIDFEDKFNDPINLEFEPIEGGLDQILLDVSVEGSKIKYVDQIVDYIKQVSNNEDVIARYQFRLGDKPHGASGIVMQDTSKFVTFHSWPEYNLLTIDFIGFTEDEAHKFVDIVNGKVLDAWGIKYH